MDSGYEVVEIQIEGKCVRGIRIPPENTPLGLRNYVREGEYVVVDLDSSKKGTPVYYIVRKNSEYPEDYQKS